MKPDAIRDVVRTKLELREAAEKREARQDAFSDYLAQLGMLADSPPPKPATKPRARA